MGEGVYPKERQKFGKMPRGHPRGRWKYESDVEKTGVDWELLLQEESWQDREGSQGLVNIQTEETEIGS